MKHTAKTIQEALENKYFKVSQYVVPNIYAFHPRYKETDFLVVNKSGYCYDIEVKVSRADYKADFKKVDKHQILSEGTYTTRHRAATSKGKKWVINEKGSKIKVKKYPNRFYYAVPEGLITVEELPEYAGLLYISDTGVVTKVKEAKLLHKTKLNIEKLLCRKFYFRMINAENALKICKKRKR